MTAVKWLEKEFIELEHTIGVHFKMYELIDKAKEMENQQQDDYAIEFGEYLDSLTTEDIGTLPIRKLLEIFKK